MAKRAASEQEAYNPVGEALAKEVMARGRQPRQAETPADEQRPREQPSRQASNFVQHPRAEPPAAERTEKPAATQTTERLSSNSPLRVLLPSEESDDFTLLVNMLAKRLGTRVKASHILRACIRSLLRAEEHLLRRAEKVGRLIRPPNNDPLALAEFEDALTDLIDGAFHDTTPRRSGRFQRPEA